MGCLMPKISLHAAAPWSVEACQCALWCRCAVHTNPIVTHALGVQNEFPNVNPIIPTHYFYLAKRCFKALQENNGKVRKSFAAGLGGCSKRLCMIAR